MKHFNSKTKTIKIFIWVTIFSRFNETGKIFLFRFQIVLMCTSFTKKRRKNNHLQNIEIITDISFHLISKNHNNGGKTEEKNSIIFSKVCFCPCTFFKKYLLTWTHNALLSLFKMSVIINCNSSKWQLSNYLKTHTHKLQKSLSQKHTRIQTKCCLNITKIKIQRSITLLYKYNFLKKPPLAKDLFVHVWHAAHWETRPIHPN